MKRENKIKSTINDLDNYGLSFFLFYFLILFSFDLFFHLSIFRTLGLELEVIGHTVTSVTSDGRVTTLIMGLREGSKRFWNKVTLYNINTTYWPHALHMVIRVGYTVASMDHL